MSDLDFTLRKLARHRSSTLVAVADLAIGVAAVTVVFALVRTILIAPLQYPESDRLLRLRVQNQEGTSPHVAALDFVDWCASATSFSGLAAYDWKSYVVGDGGDAEQLLGARVTPGFFATLGIDPAHGRAFAASDGAAGTAPVAVLSHGLWQRRYGGAEELLGRTVDLDGTAVTVIGVAPAGLDFPQEPDLWTPLVLGTGARSRSGGSLNVVGRLRQSVSLSEAQGEMDVIANRLATAHPETNTGRGVVLQPLKDDIVEGARSPLLILLAAVVLVLGIAGFNLGSLTLARTARRRVELGVRQAMGAGRLRLFALVMLEDLLIGLAGAAIGLGLAVPALRVVLSRYASHIPRASEVSVDGLVCGVAIVAAVGCALLCGLAPALRATGAPVADALSAAGRSPGAAATSRRALRLVILVEVALALVVSAAAVLLGRSFGAVLAVDPGFEPEHTLTALLDLPPSRYPSGAEQVSFATALQTRLEALPGVESAATIHPMPLSWSTFSAGVTPEGERYATAAERPRTGIRLASPGAIETLRIPVVCGRPIELSDGDDATLVALVNRSFADRYFGSSSAALGKRLSFAAEPYAADDGWLTIVGVVADVHHRGLDQGSGMEVYLSALQAPYHAMSLIVRTDGDPLAAATAVRAAVRELDARLPLIDLQTGESLLDRSLGRRRFAAGLLAAFCAIALCLAAFGVFGVIGLTVTERAHELGIRAALGASPGELVRMVLAAAMTPAALGAALGLGGALAAGRVLQSQLFAIGPHDPWSLALAVLTVLIAACLAALGPALRAARRDPMQVLRP